MATASGSTTLAGPSSTGTGAAVATVQKVQLGATLQAIFHGVLPSGATGIDPTKASMYVQQLAQSNPSEFLVLQRMLMNSGAIKDDIPLGTTPESTTATSTAFQELLQSTQNGQGGLTAGGKAQNASQVLSDFGGSNGQTVSQGNGTAAPKPVDIQGKNVDYTPENANTIEQTVGDDLQSMSGIGLTADQAQQAVAERQGSQAADAQAEEDQDNAADQAQYTQDVHQQQAQQQNNTNLIVQNSVPNPDIKNPGQFAQAVLGYLGVQNDPQAVAALTAYVTSAGHWGDGSKNPLGLKLAVGNSNHDPKTYAAQYTSWAQSIVATASIIAKDPTVLQGFQNGDDQAAVVGLNNATGNRVSKNGFAVHQQAAQGFTQHMTKQQQQKFNKLAQQNTQTGMGAIGAGAEPSGAANQGPNNFTTNTPAGGGIEGMLPKNAGGTRAKKSLLSEAAAFTGKGAQRANKKGAAQQGQNPYAVTTGPDGTETAGPGWMGGTAVKQTKGKAGNPNRLRKAVSGNAGGQSVGAGIGSGLSQGGNASGGSLMSQAAGFAGAQAATSPTGSINSNNNNPSSGPAMSGQDVVGGTPSNIGNMFTPGKVTSLPAQIGDEDIARQIALGPDRQQTLGNDYLESYLKLMDWMNTTADSMESRFGAGSHG